MTLSDVDVFAAAERFAAEGRHAARHASEARRYVIYAHALLRCHD